MIAPLSGPWARQGQLLKMGAEMAIDDINAAGGIKALGGAKLEIVYADAGDSTEKAKNAAQRLLSDQPELAGGFGAWLSSFTLAVTEVTERASASVADPQLFRRDHQSRLQIRLPDLADRRPSGRGDLADRAQTGGSRYRQDAEDDRHHPGQHRLAGQLRQAAARWRARQGWA